MSARLVTSYASSANAVTHNIPLTGKTNGRDMFCIALASATFTPSSPWVLEHSELLNVGGCTAGLFRITAANNGSGYSGPFSITLNGPVALAALVWEDDLDLGTSSIYCDFVDSTNMNNTAAPLQLATGLHTFTTRDVAFAFLGLGVDSGNSGLDIVSYDNSYLDFGDSTWAGTTEGYRVWLASKASTSFSSGGVTGTGNNGSIVSGRTVPITGMIAYDQLATTPAAPANTVAPAITGTTVTGSVLTCSTGTWTGYPAPTFTYQWMRNGVAITGATNNTYTLVTADETKTIWCVVTGTNATAAVAANSNSVVPTSGAGGTPPSNTVAPSLTGTPVAGNVMTCSAGTWTGTPTPTFTYQWKRAGTNISGATASTYTLTGTDVGALIKCTVTATNTAGTSSVDSNTVTPTSPTSGTIKQAQLHRLHGGVWENINFSVSSGGGGGGSVHSAKPEDFGAKGDGKSIADATMTAGSATLTSAAGGFVAGDAGKKILVRAAGTTANGGNLVGTISTYNSATSVTLNVTATNSVSGVSATYGTDDTGAFKSALNQIVTDAMNDGSYAVRLDLSAKCYIIAGAPVVGGTTAGNAQIPLPNVVTTGKKLTVAIQGPVDGSGFYHWKQQVPATSGATLYGMLVNTTPDGTYHVASLLGGPTSLPSDGGTSPFSNILVNLDGFRVVLPRNPSYVGIDLNLCAQANIGSIACVVDASPNKSGLEAINGSATNQQGMGLRMPAFQNNDNTNLFSYGCEGFYYGIAIADHFTAQRLALIYCDTAIYCSPGGGAEHGSFIGYISCEACNNGLECNAGSGSRYPIFIGRFDVEVAGGGVTFKDPQNSLTGEIHFAANTVTPPSLTGALNVKIIDDHKYTGYVASGAPAVPASTVALRNPFFRDAAVFISGGTVSAVAIDGQTTFTATGCMVIVPNNRQITLTYSSAPTWKWFLL